MTNLQVAATRTIWICWAPCGGKQAAGRDRKQEVAAARDRGEGSICFLCLHYLVETIIFFLCLHYLLEKKGSFSIVT